MKLTIYEGKIWTSRNKEVDPSLLQLLTSKDGLIILSHGKPPYKVILGVPHQAAVGEEHICESGQQRDSDENAASYALVAFTILKEHEIPCKLVIAAHLTKQDPNKHPETLYCEEVFRNPTRLFLECHGMGDTRKLDLELSAGANDLANTIDFGRTLASAIPQRYSLGVQKKAGTDDSLIFRNGKEEVGKLERPATKTESLKEAKRGQIAALHIEAKPKFRIPADKTNSVTPDGLIVGQALAQMIIKDWIDEELQIIKQSYEAQVLNMTGAYNREIERTKEYHGRQLLELLQNADDEAEETQNPRVLIRLEQNRLIVANNGMPFSRLGVLSLMYSDNSPKVNRRRKIGYKGLGFRAILNWSQSIWIKSGAFSLEFSRSNAVGFLKKLLEKKESLKEDIQEASTEKHPIATLAVPSWKGAGGVGTSKYDTYVIINFSSEEIEQDIQSQINELGMEVPLFLNNITKIELESPERNETIVKIPSKEDGYEEIQVLDEQGSMVKSKKWRIFPKSGELPQHLRKDEMTRQYEYELRIAVSERMDDNINRLFSYFKTETKFPFPAIIHGTFDLDGNRNHLNHNAVNQFLLGQLAELMTETAKELTQSKDKISWDAIKLLAKRGEFDDKLEKMKFYEKLLASIRAHKLIPVLSNKYMSADEKPFFYDIPLAQELEAASSEFSELAFYTSDKQVQALLRELGIGRYDPEDLVKRLNKVSTLLDSEKRAKLITLLGHYYDGCLKPLPPDKMPRLLIDDQGQVIDANTKALLPPEGAKFQLPEFARIVFISKDLANRLRDKAGVKRVRDLTHRLTRFNIQEYSAASVIGRIVATTNRAIRKVPSKRTEYIQKMVDALFMIFNDKTYEETKFPERVNVPLFTRKGELQNARKLYFGREYSIGKIMDTLYSKIHDTVFLGDKQDLGLGRKSEKDAVTFLKWSGVEEFPGINRGKLLIGQDYDPDYDEYVLRNLEYPYQTNYGEVLRSYEDLKAKKDFRSTILVADIEEFEKILEKARFEDILVWLHHDPRIQIFFREKHEPPESSFQLSLRGTRVYRNLKANEISSYIVWKLRTIAWVRTRGGNKVVPTQCCLSETLVGMAPLIELPNINLKGPVFKEHRMARKDIEYVLTQVGVSEDLSTLPTETVYAVLSELEAVDPEGEKAKTIYTGILRSKPKEWDSTLQNSEAYDSFIKNGKILAKSDGKMTYLPVSQVYYVDNITFCREIINKFPIVEIPRRSGKSRVKQIFGVTPLEDIQFRLTSKPELHPLNAQFSKHFESFKPYLLVFRLATPKFTTELNDIRRLRISLCTRINAKYIFNKTEGELTLNPYEHIQPAEENTVYLLLNPNKSYNNVADLKKDIDFCDVLAEIVTNVLKVDENHDLYTNLFSRDRQERDIITRKKLDDPTLQELREVRQRFRDITDLQKEFWQNVLIAKGVEKDIFELDSDEETIRFLSKELDLHEEILEDVFKGIDYDQLPSMKNLVLIKKLFTALSISIKDFNLHASEHIDFSEDFDSEVTSEKFKLQKRFQAYLYERLKDKGVASKQTFLNMGSTYEKTSFVEHYDVNEKLEVGKEKCFDIVFKEEPFKDLGLTYSTLAKQEEKPLEELYSKNKHDFLKKLRESGGAYAEDIEALLENSENKSLVYFAKHDELIRRFDAQYQRPSTTEASPKGDQIVKKKKTIMVNGKEEEYEENNYESILENIKKDLEQNKYDISKHEPSKPPGTAAGGHTGYGGGGYGTARQKHPTETGFVGEAYVYETLVSKYGKDNVFWVSENAKKADVNPQGSESKGYDMHYIDENDKVHYVEVKSTSTDDNSFKISPEEVRFGEQHDKDYEVIQALKTLGQEREMKNLGNIFHYGEDESFNNNSKFTVENEGFRIKFN